MFRTFRLIFIGMLLSVSAFAANWTGSTSEPENTKKIDGKVFYVITSAEELAWFAAQVNSGKSTINAVLANDIKFMTDTSKTSSVNWTPIGKDSTAMFNGTFDGAGKTIYGLYCSSKFSGIFGVTNSNAVVKNVNSKNGEVKGDYSGGIVAFNNGWIENCVNGNKVSASSYAGGIAGLNYGTISGCTNRYAVSASSYAGGIAGLNYGTISGCTNRYAVSASSYAGGIAGLNYGTISGCTNRYAVSASSYAGGIAGLNYGTISGCTNRYAVSASSYSYAGGIAGLNYGTISKSKNTSSIIGYSREANGGIAGVNYGTVFDCVNDGLVYGTGLVYENSATGKLLNSFNVWKTRSSGVIRTNSGTVTNCYYDSDVLTNSSTVAPNSGLHTADMQRDQFAWILNTTNGTAENSGVWSRDSTGYPIFADSAHRPIYKVVFNDDGATSNRYTNFKGTVSFPENPEAPEGKMFSGWYTDDGVKVKETTVFTADMTVNAVYIDASEVYFAIRFFNADSTLLDSQSVQYGKTPSYDGTPTLASTAQYSYAFAGWHVETTAATEDFDYYAVYTETLNAYVVRFLDYDGTELQNSSYLYGATPGLSPDPTRESTVAYDYTFAGWTPAVAKVTKAADYTALYDSSKVVYTVTFMNGSEKFASVQTPYGEAAAAPNPSPSRKGYKFVGWSKSLSSVTSDMTVLALFEELVYHNITISRGDGEDETIRVEEDSLFTLPAAPEKDGHRFVGWYDADGNFLGNAGDTIRIQVDIQIVAHFEALSSSSVAQSSSSSVESSSSSEAKSSSSSVEKSSSSEGESSSSSAIEKSSSSSAEPVESSSSKEVIGILAQAPVRAWTATAVGRTFQIHAAPVGKPYALFDLQGKVLATGRVESSEMTISVPRAGSFVVRIGRNTVRMNAK